MRTVLVTGCSSGFGRAAALAFARAGDRVYATVRRDADRAGLEAEGRGRALHVLQLDVTDPAACRAAVQRVAGAAGGIDVLINNAGINVPGAFEDMDAADLERVMRTNFFGPVWLTRAALAPMRAAGAGLVIMISSLSARVGLPGESIYAASKAALEAAAEALRREVARFGIRVCVIEPGLFATGMPAKLAGARRAPPGSAYAPLLDHLVQRAADRHGKGEDPQRLAELLLRVADLPAPPLRIAAGAQAEAVCARLATLPDTERDAFLDAVNDTAWWSSPAGLNGRGSG